MDENNENDQNPRSVNSNHKCYVRFINTTEKTIEITWINFMGQYVRYRILEKANYIDVNTYKTHPWIARDFLTKDVLQIDGKFIYHPKTTKEYIQERYPDRSIPEHYEARVRAYISIPVYSLRYASLLTLRNSIFHEEHVDELCLPKNLSDDLKKIIVKRNRECLSQGSQLQYNNRV